MTNLRRLHPGVISRKVATDLICSTIYGNKTVVKDTCDSCGQLLSRSAFYMESDSKKKMANQPRTQCVVCWDALKGKKSRASYPPTQFLDSFMEEENA